MYKTLITRNTTILITLGVLCALVFLVFFAVNSYNADRTKLELMEKEVAEMQKKVNILKLNSAIPQDELNEYNKILTQLIPDKEDFFSIIYALETLSQKTGFSITDYAINLSESTKEKYSLLVEGTGDTSSFLSFLRDYHFSGGRLITNEKIEFTTDDGEVSKLSLNFYNKKIPTDIAQITEVTPNDIKLMKTIQSKITVNLTAPSGEVESYPTKSNPF